MNELTTFSESQLPDTLEDLTQFVLVGKAKLNAYMLKLQTVNKLSVAQEIRDQTLKETQEISTALIAAEQRIGELLLAIPKASGQYAESKNRPVSKNTLIKDMGYSKDEASDYQQMARNPEVVQKVIEDAIANGEVVTKTQVMKEIKAAKAEMAEKIASLERESKEREDYITEIESREPEIKTVEVVKEVVPDDYEKLKSNVKMYRTQAKSAEESRLNTVEELKKAKARIKDLEERKDIAELQRKLEEEAGYFAIRTYDYIQKNGGYVWITERMEQLPEKQRKEFINTVYAIDAFAKQMIQNIGGYGVE